MLAPAEFGELAAYPHSALQLKLGLSSRMGAVASKMYHMRFNVILFSVTWWYSPFALWQDGGGRAAPEAN